MEFQAPEKSAMLNWKFKVTTMANSVDFQEGFPQILGSSHADWSQLLLYCYLYLVPKQKRREAYIHNYSSLLPTVQVFLSRSLDAPAFHPLMLGNSLCIRPAGQSEALELPQEKRKKPFLLLLLTVLDPLILQCDITNIAIYFLPYSVPWCFMLLLMYAFQLRAVKHLWTFINHKNHSSKILITLYHTLNLDWTL